MVPSCTILVSCPVPWRIAGRFLRKSWLEIETNMNVYHSPDPADE
jgi:hypothetical protein